MVVGGFSWQICDVNVLFIGNGGVDDKVVATMIEYSTPLQLQKLQILMTDVTGDMLFVLF